MLWVLKRTVSMRRFFEHPEQMLKLMDKKIFTILHSNILSILIYLYNNFLISIGPVKQKIWAKNCNYFLTEQSKHMLWSLKKTSHWDGSFEYPQHMFWLRNKNNNIQLPTLIWRPEYLFVFYVLDRIFPVIHNTDGMDQSGNSTGNGSAGQGGSHTSPHQGPPTPGAPSSKTPSQTSPQTWHLMQ